MFFIFGYQMCFNLQDGFLLVIIKCCYLCFIIYELLWFLQGNINIVYLYENNVIIWDEWVDENGDFGLVYGKQWCVWLMLDGCYIDQIIMVLNQLKNDLDLCCIIVLVWNVGELDKMVLVLCYVFFQFYVVDGKFFCQFYQCFCDVFFGLLFNIVSYVLLVYMMVQQCDLEVGDFVWIGGDMYLYSNYMD